jgi:hypothetical protein
MESPLESIFQSKYNEFMNSLVETFPELAQVVEVAKAVTPDEREKLYKQMVMPNAGNPKRDMTKTPGMVLPGVFINDAMWASSSQGTKDAINQFLSLLTFAIKMKEGKSGEFGVDSDAFRSWADSFMDDWRGKMNRTEFDSFTKRFSDLFGSTAASGERLPPFPEKLRKGKLVKLAEEIVRELKPEEFGLDAETIKQCETDPSKAFEVIMNSTMRNPEKLQGAMKRIMKRLQDKFQRGEFKPQELAAEAEEMMKEFSENPAFVEMMDSMRKAFSFEGDMDAARAAGQEKSAKLNIAQERMRKELARRKEAAAKAAAKTGNEAVTPVANTTNVTNTSASDVNLVDEFVSILSGTKTNNKKQGKK